MDKDFILQRNEQLYNFMNNNNDKLAIYNSNKKIIIEKNNNEFILKIINKNSELNNNSKLNNNKKLNINQLKSLLQELSKLNIEIETINFNISEIYAKNDVSNNNLNNDFNNYSPVGFDNINLNNEFIINNDVNNQVNNNFRIDSRDPSNLCGS